MIQKLSTQVYFRLSLSLNHLSVVPNNFVEHEICPSYLTTISRVSLCIQSGHHPIPAIWFCVDGLNHVLMVLNSSLNFFIYCLVGKKFRTELCSFFRSLFVTGKYSSEVRVVTAVWMWTNINEYEALAPKLTAKVRWINICPLKS